MPVCLPAPPPPRVPLAWCWGLEASRTTDAPTGAPGREAARTNSRDLAAAPSTDGLAILPQWIGPPGLGAPDTALPAADTAPQADSSQGAQQTAPAYNTAIADDTVPARDAVPNGNAAPGLDAASELAFGVRWLPSAMPSGLTAGAHPAPAAAGSELRIPAVDAPAQPEIAEVSAAGRVPQIVLPPDGTSTSGRHHGDTQRDAGGASGMPEDRQNSTTPADDAGPPAHEAASVAIGNAPGRTGGDAAPTPPPLVDRHGDGRGGNAPAPRADADGVWNSVTALPAERESQPPGPAAAPPAAVEPPEPAAQPPSRGVSLHLADGESTVDIRMAEHAGEIRVTVHTPDRGLADSLRAELPDLVGKLRQNGYQAEAWRPAAAAQAESGRRNGSGAAPSQEHPQGADRDGRRRQPRQSKNQSQWAGEWNATLDPTKETSI